MTNSDRIKAIQAKLGIVVDGVAGIETWSAIHFNIVGNEPENEVHHVMASSFADPADVAAFKRCKANGGSDAYCFAKGDNAVGLWGDSTAEGTGPSCALPPEDWNDFYHAARFKRVLVKVGDKQVICELKDTMPHKKNIRNGAGIDLNPDACTALGLTSPIMVAATWEWV